MKSSLVNVNGQPIRKTKSFCPNPVVQFGIPDCADSYSNSAVIGTTLWKDWWTEQFDYCINGYETGGMWIPGRYYYYLNFFNVSTVGKGNHAPMYVDLDYEFFLMVEEAKRTNKGIISIKARRKGLSYKVVGGIFDYGFRFGRNYQAGICAGLQTHADGFFTKFKNQEALVPPELRLHKLQNNDDIIVAGYTEKTDTGWLHGGMKNTVFCKTMFSSANVFKGEMLDDCVFEEGGEFEMLQEGYEATKPCFMVGDDMEGTPYIYGTGGNMMKGSKGFSEMWAESESYNLMRFWVSAKKLYFPCVAGSLDRKLKINEDIPNLKAKFPEPYMRIGMQDEKQAEFRILERRKLQEKKVNKKPYYDDIQNYPLNTKEAFLTFSSNNYNSVLLNEMQLELMNNEDRFGTYVLEYKKDTNGVPITPLEIFARPAVLDQTKPNRDAPESCVKIHFKGFPMPQYRNLDVAGLDGYDIDLSQTSKSLGAMLVYRRKIEDSSIPGNMPVCMYYDRPKKKELFYELCFKIAVFYNLIENVMCDAGSPLVIDYFEKNGGVKYLAKRPKELESDSSTQQHKFGMKFTTFSRPVIESFIQSDIEDNIHKWVFHEMVGDCNSYQEGNKDNDNDVHDALGLAKARVVDMKARPINIKERQENDPTMIVERYISPEGHVMTREVKAANNPASNVQGDLFMQMLEQGRIG